MLSAGHVWRTTFRLIFARPRVSIVFGTVLAVKGSLRRAQLPRALDSSEPFLRNEF